MSYIQNRYTKLLGIEHPIVQEGMGPFRTPKLAAAVSNAGGLGTVSTPGFPFDLEAAAREFREHIEECASLTDRPFAVNIPVGVDSNGDVLPFSDVYVDAAFEARRADRAVAERLTVMTTSAGFPGPYIQRIKDEGMIHQHKVGATRQAIKSAEAGVDVIIAAGFEMGGHAPSKEMHTFVLVPSITEAVDVPVLLTGGARDGRGLAAALSLGADGVAMGTRFIASMENSDWNPRYIEAILAAKEGEDIAFDGVYGPCRALRNDVTTSLATPGVGVEGDPIQRVREKIALMKRAQTDGDTQGGIVLAGQVSSAIQDIISVADFVPSMAREAAEILRRLTADVMVAPEKV